MRNLTRIIERIENKTWGQCDAPARVPRPAEPRKPRTYAWRAPDAKARDATAAEFEAHRHFQKDAVMTGAIAARSLKVTVPLPPAGVAALAVPDGQARVKLTVTYDGGSLRADVSRAAAHVPPGGAREPNNVQPDRSVGDREG
jgi:hypothetical protein